MVRSTSHEAEGQRGCNPKQAGPCLSRQALWVSIVFGNPFQVASFRPTMNLRVFNQFIANPITPRDPISS
jgi:hypothetical protein